MLHFKPGSGLGIWGLSVTLLFVALFVAKITIHFALPSFVIFGVGFLGLALNIWAMMRGERSILFLAVGTFVGLFLIVFVGGEVLFPH